MAHPPIAVADSSINARAAAGPVCGADEHADKTIRNARAIANIEPPSLKGSLRQDVGNIKSSAHNDVFICETLFENAGKYENVHRGFILLASNRGIQTPGAELLVSRNSILNRR